MEMFFTQYGITIEKRIADDKMRYIVLDMEWNQPYAPKCVDRAPFPLIGEIIQIGAVMLEEQADELAEFFQLVWIPQSANCGGGMSIKRSSLCWNYKTSAFRFLPKMAERLRY